MKKFLKIAILSIAAASAVAAPISTASADSWRGNGGWNNGRHNGWHGNRPDWNRPPPNRGPKWDRPRKRDNGNAIAAGVIGLAAGAIIAGALSQPSSPSYAPPPPRVYYPPQPAYNAYPPAPVQYRGGAQPWSQAWYNYCSQKFRSFNPKTGTYRGYDGADHFCVAN